MIETTSYEIKHFEPEFTNTEIAMIKEIEQQHELPEVYRSFQSESQVNQLKNYRDGGVPNFPFVATDHFYLFDREEMVGVFHTFPQQTTKRCSIGAILTKSGHEAGASLLFDAAVTSLKERDYEVLVKNTTEDHNLELAFLDQFGFERIKLRNLKAIASIEELNIAMNDSYQLQDYDEELHKEAIIEQLYLPRGYKRQQLENQFTNMKTNRENGTIPSWVVASDPDGIVGQSLAFYSKSHLPYLIQFNTVTTNIEGDAALPLINAIYSSHLSKLPETVTHVEHYLFGQVAHLRETYEKLGFSYIENHVYEKSI